MTSATDKNMRERKNPFILFVHFEFISLSAQTESNDCLFAGSISMAAAAKTNRLLCLMFTGGMKLRCPFMSMKCLLFEQIPLCNQDREINTEIKILLAFRISDDQLVQFFFQRRYLSQQLLSLSPFDGMEKLRLTFMGKLFKKCCTLNSQE